MPSILEMHKLFNSRDVKILLNYAHYYYSCKVCIMYMYSIVYNLFSYYIP